MIFAFLLFPLTLCLLVQAQNVLPRAPHNSVRSAALAELHNVILKGRADHEPAVHLRPRLHIDAKRIRPRAATSNSSPATVKRTFLGARQSCPAGSDYCSESGRCCPNDGTGKCCDDGTCISGSQECCLDGGACDEGLQCCINGCAPQGAQCCSDGDYHCDPGYQCCGNGKCAPDDGECCADGSVCDSGLLCVIYDGEQACCEDLSCSDYSVGGGTGGSDDDTSLTDTYTYSRTYSSIDFHTYSLPSITLPSYTPLPSLPSFTIPTFSPLSLPDATFTPPPVPAVAAISDILSLGAPPTSATGYSFYYTTWTWYYWYFYIASSTIVSTVSFTTSTRVTTRVPFTCYATASTEADSTFSSVERAVTLPSSITATGFDAFVATAEDNGAEPTASVAIPTGLPSLTGFAAVSEAGRLHTGWEESRIVMVIVAGAITALIGSV